MRLHSFTLLLFRSAQPDILPCDGDILVVSAKADVRAIVVTHLHRLVFVQGKRGSCPDARAALASVGIGQAIQAGNSAKPKIAVQREPKPWLHIVTQMAFKGPDGLFCLRLGV